MSEKTIYCCESCPKTTDNNTATKGWIRLTGSISRAHGVVRDCNYVTDYVEGGNHDYCSLECLDKALFQSFIDVQKKKTKKTVL
jgi:hypothetical protein